MTEIPRFGEPAVRAHQRVRSVAVMQLAPDVEGVADVMTQLASSDQAARTFSQKSEDEQAAVRAAQLATKAAKQRARDARKEASASHTNPTEVMYPTEISQADYFAACSGGLFRDARLPPTGRSCPTYPNHVGRIHGYDALVLWVWPFRGAE